MKKKKGIVVRPPKLTEDRRTKGRAIMTLKLLWQLMKAARDQVDPVTWIKEGGLDAEEFLECLETGRWHPLLKRWDVMKGTDAANRPAPTSRERAARRAVVLAVIGLRQVTSMKGDEARRTVAAAMPRLFDKPPSAETIHHWERETGSGCRAGRRMSARRSTAPSVVRGMTAMPDLDIAHWRRDPIAFIEHVLRDSESRKPFVLSNAERQFLALAFVLDDNGWLKFPEMTFGAIKKSGKTTLAAIVMLTMVLLFGGRFAEGYCVANDYEQAQSRVFAIIKRIIEASPLLRAIAKVTSDRVAFPALGASIIAIASDAASAAGANPVITTFDELWGYTSERARRLWDEMITSPARRISARLTVSYAGFSGESVLLEELYKRGMALPEVGPSLHAGDGMLFAWHCAPTQPWQTEAWLAEMWRSLRPSAFARMTCNEFVGSESQFVDLSAWDACTIPSVGIEHDAAGLNEIEQVGSRRAQIRQCLRKFFDFQTALGEPLR
jgi:hypothetical protein